CDFAGQNTKCPSWKFDAVSAALETQLNVIKSGRCWPGQETNRGIYASRCASVSKCGFASPRLLRDRTADRYWSRSSAKRRHPRPGSVGQIGERKCGPCGRSSQG